MIGFLFRSKLLSEVYGVIHSGYQAGITNKPKFWEIVKISYSSYSSREYNYIPSEVISAAQKTAQTFLDRYNSGNYTEHEKKVANIVLSHFFDKRDMPSLAERFFRESLAESIVRAYLDSSSGKTNTKSGHKESIKRVYLGIDKSFYI